MIKQCLRCNKDFYTYAYRISIGKGKYCSRDCYATAPERLKKCSENTTGIKNPMYGTKGILNPQFREKSPHWKGNNVSYKVLHKWINRNKSYSGFCEECGIREKSTRKLDAANISRDYKRDINDFKYLCVRCHRKFDITPKIRARLLLANQKRWHPELFI